MTVNHVQVKRVYDAPSPADGARVLVDRLWPRGVRKERAHLSLWLKDAAPSPALRQWFDHRADRWREFTLRYRAELKTNPAIARLHELQRQGAVTLLYAARDENMNHARVLAEFLAASGRKRS